MALPLRTWGTGLASPVEAGPRPSRLGPAGCARAPVVVAVDLPARALGPCGRFGCRSCGPRDDVGVCEYFSKSLSQSAHDIRGRVGSGVGAAEA
jgi:hypothetical protein